METKLAHVETTDSHHEVPLSLSEMHVHAPESKTAKSDQTITEHVKEEHPEKMQPLTDVIERLSYEKFPEYVRKNDSTLTFPEKVRIKNFSIVCNFLCLMHLSSLTCRV